MIDNLKSGVLEHPPGLPPRFNPRYLDFAAHYGFIYHLSIFAAFTLKLDHPRWLQLDVLPVERGDFRYPCTGVVHKFKEDAVAPPAGGCRGWSAQDSLYL